MSAYKGEFNRWELKYLVHIKTMYRVIKSIESYVAPDENGAEGMYKISSLYYDTPDFRFYREKADGQKFRQKLRLRKYAADNEYSFFEIKQRYNSTVMKRRVRLRDKEAHALAKGISSSRQYPAEQRGVIEQVEYMMSVNALVPKLNVSYMRRAFTGKYENDLRVTFDTNLKCSRHNDNENQKYMIHPSYAVMEIKADERVPMWLIRIIQKYNLEANRVSKYCLGVETLFENY